MNAQVVDHPLENAARKLIIDQNLPADPALPALVNLALQPLEPEGDPAEGLIEQGLSPSLADNLSSLLPSLNQSQLVMAIAQRSPSPKELSSLPLPEVIKQMQLAVATTVESLLEQSQE